MSKKGIIRIVLIISVLLTAILLYWLIKISGKTANPWSLIPEKSAIIIEVENTNNTLSWLNNDNPIWQSLKKVHEINQLKQKLTEFDSAFSTTTSFVDNIKKGSLYVALIPDSVSQVEPLVVIIPKSPISSGTIKSNLESYFNRKYGILKMSGLSNTIRIVSASDESTTYLSVINGAIILTNNPDIIALAHQTYDKKTNQLSINPELEKIKTTARTKGNLTVYINYSHLGTLINPTLNTKTESAINWISEFGLWSDLELLLKKEEIILSGYTSSENTGFLSTLADQKPVKTNVFNIVPYNTNLLLWQGFSDFSAYFNQAHTTAQSASISASVNYEINKLVNIIGNEITIVSNAEQPQSVANNTWFIAKISDKNTAANILKRIALNTGYKKLTKHKNYNIRRISKDNFIGSIFGNAYAEITKNYYTFINDYVVFANSQESLKNLINNYETGKTLDLNDNFKAFSDNINSKSNILFYIQPGETLGRLNTTINNHIVKLLAINETTVKSFSGLSLQYTASTNGMFFTNLYIKYSGAIREENLAIWKTPLDFEIVHGPYLVTDHNTKKENIIVFDKMANMYLIDSDGEIIWKRKLDAIPISDVWEADYYKNRKIQYLFNTPDNIYLIDKNGRNVVGYPKKLHSKATNGLALFDYLNNKDYRLLIAQSDKRIHNYGIKTNEIQGWKKPVTQNIVITPAKRLQANKKDYIIITDIDNNIQIVNRKGKRRIKVSGNINKAANSDYYVNRTNSKGIIITTNKQGKLVYISASGKLKTTDFGNFSPNHFFLYEDFNGDKSKDFIYIDGNKLVVFDRFKKVLSSYTFSSNITIAPKFFSFGRNEQVLGVVADKEKTIYLFDKKGNIIVSRGLVGETPFTVGRLEGNRSLNLVSASGNVLYNYLLK